MSSEILTDLESPSPSRRPERARGETFRPWHLFAIGSLLAATAAVWLVRPAGIAQLLLLSLAIGAGGLVAIAFHRTIWPLLASEFTDAVAMVGPRTRAALEQDKQQVLRAIKELEFDRAMGKVGESDFEELRARLRARALALLRQLEQGDSPYRALIERELRARLAARLAVDAATGAAKGHGRSAAQTPGVAAAPAATVPGRGERLQACRACGTANDADARFCKHCGAKLAEAS